MTAMMDSADLRGIQQMAEELGITQRTIRFYEDKGLIEPQRAGTTRVYTRREFARMQLILRGKALGFSLRDIKDFLDLYDHDPAHIEQTHLLATRVADRITELEHQQRAIVQTLAELRLIERQSLDRIRQVEG
jgi:DNA-binding transcriptional MerR regulator